MTVALPVSADPAALTETPKDRGRWQRLPAKAKVGTVLLGLFVLAAIIGPFVTPYDPSFQNPNPALSLQPPSAAHLLGTTQSGQDVLSQLLVGIRLTLELAVIVGVVATALSVLVGVTAAFLGGFWDDLLSLLSNVFLVIPALPLLILLLGYLPQRGQTATILVLSLLGWPWGARVIRAQTLAIRNRDFVAAAKETGEGSWRIITFEIMPNEVSLIAASFVNTVLYAIGASVALAFIGLADLSSWSLGTMLYWAQSQQALQLGAWWWFVPPGLAVALIGTGLVLLNTGIDELGNPRLRDASRTSKIGGRRLHPADPTPVLQAAPPPRRSLAGLLHAFSRDSLLEERGVGSAPAARQPGRRPAAPQPGRER
jgi:peptide/nickel transport system permease protein